MTPRFTDPLAAEDYRRRFLPREREGQLAAQLVWAEAKLEALRELVDERRFYDDADEFTLLDRIEDILNRKEVE